MAVLSIIFEHKVRQKHNTSLAINTEVCIESQPDSHHSEKVIRYSHPEHESYQSQELKTQPEAREIWWKHDWKSLPWIDWSLPPLYMWHVVAQFTLLVVAGTSGCVGLNDYYTVVVVVSSGGSLVQPAQLSQKELWCFWIASGHSWWVFDVLECVVLGVKWVKGGYSHVVWVWSSVALRHTVHLTN